MTIYFIIIFFSLLLGLFYQRCDSTVRKLVDIFFISVFVIIIGFRYEVGVDWFNYIRVYYRLTANPFSIDTPEILYKAINVIAYYLDYGIVTVIFLCTVLFALFTIKGPKYIGVNPYYFFAIVAPYHFVMSGVNYTRQGVALSIMIYAFAVLMRNEKRKFLLLTLAAGMFHNSALPFVIFLFIDVNIIVLIFSALVILPLVTFLSLDRYQQYINSDIDSAGMWLRAVFLLVPTFYIIINKAYLLDKTLHIKRLYYSALYFFPITAILSFVSSTIADRFSYYFILMSALLVMKMHGDGGFKNFVHRSGPLAMFLASFIALIIWCLKTKYLNSYLFDSYFIYWLQ